MTTNSIPATVDYIEDGATLGPLAVPFKFLHPDDLVIDRINVAAGTSVRLARGADYSVTGAGNAAGGFITKTSGGIAGALLRVQRFTARVQPMKYQANDTFPAASHEAALDRGIMIDQEQQAALFDILARGVLLPPGEVVGLLPPAIQRRGRKLLGFNSVTGALEVQTPTDFKGDPGGNVMAIGAFANANGLTIPVGTDLVQTKGYAVGGIGVAQYIADPIVTAAYVVANPRTSFITANGRGFRLIAENIVDVTWFGARGDDATDDTAAIQAAVNFMKGRNGGTLFFPRGDYRVSAPIDCGNNSTGMNRVILKGAGGVGFGGAFPKTGSRIYGTHAGDIFRWASCSYVAFLDLTFDGAGCTAIRHSGTPTIDYLEYLVVLDCHFFGALKECIYGNLIYAKIFRNSFGYFGTVGAAHRHIYCMGTATNGSNSNRIRSNRFYYAKGSQSCRFDSGSDNTFEDNNWEQNTALPLALYGMPGTLVSENWFELNSLTAAEIELGSGANLIDSNPTRIVGNAFVPHPTTTRIVQVNSPLIGWAFDYNFGNGTGKQLTNDASKLFSRLGNNLSGLSIPTRLYQEGGNWNVTDASGAGLSIPALGPWERAGNHVDCHVDFGFPANGSNSNAKIGGFPYPSSRVAVGKVLTNYPGGIDVAMDAGGNTATLFAAGTLTPLSNAQLAGRALYISIRYPVA